jgi:transcription-repair coupling factor (superfamily II helicase)
MKINAFIPSDYIPDEVQKLDMYKKIASIVTENDYLEIEDELVDRYGDLPISVQNLLEIAWIKSSANQLGITLISQNGEKVYIKFDEKADLDPTKLPALLHKYGRNLKCTAGKEMSMIAVLETGLPKEILRYIKSLLQDLNELKNT